MTAPLTSPPAPARFTAFSRILGIALVLLALLLGAGVEYQIRDQSRWARDLLASPSHAAMPAVQSNAHYHLANTEALRRARWSLFGHGTWAVLCAVGGAALLWRGTRRHRDGADAA